MPKKKEVEFVDAIEVPRVEPPEDIEEAQFTEIASATVDEAPIKPVEPPVEEAVLVKPLLAMGPNEKVIALSYDHGETWEETDYGREFVTQRPNARPYSRRLMAVVDDMTPSVDRRIVTPFEVLHMGGIMAGWASYKEILAQPDNSIDGLLLPALFTLEQIQNLKRVGRSFILDLDAPMIYLDDDWDVMLTMLPEMDAVIVPSPLLASKIRQYHSRVFVLPHYIRRDVWKNFTREYAKDQVTIGIPWILDEVLETTVKAITEKHGGKVNWHPFHWTNLDAEAQRDEYSKLDMVLLPPWPERTQISWAPVMGAQAAECVVIADRLWPNIIHKENGIQIMGHDAKNWIQAINGLVADKRSRSRMGHNARSFAMRKTAWNNISPICLPFRVTVPESLPITYA